MMLPTSNQTYRVTYPLDGRYESFAAEAGLSSEGTNQDAASPLTFRVLGDGKQLWESKPIQKRVDEASFSVSLRGVKELRLELDCPGPSSHAHAVWIEPRLTPVTTPSPPAASPSAVVYLDDLHETESKVGYDELRKHGVEFAGKPMIWDGAPVSHSIGMHPAAKSAAWASYALGGGYEKFDAIVGSPANPASPITFRVLGDGRELWKSAPVAKAGVGMPVSVSVRGVTVLRLEAEIPGYKNSGCNAVWIEPRLTSPTSAGSRAKGSTIDVLARIDPVADARAGQWKKENGVLEYVGSGAASLQLPVALAPSYRIEATAEKIAGGYQLVFGLPVGAGDCALYLEGYHQRVSGIETIDGKGIPFNSTRYEPPIFTQGKPTQIRIDVTPTSVRVQCDDKQIVDWNGKAEQLSSAGPRRELKTDAQTFWLGSYNTRFQISKLTYTPVVGQSNPGIS